VYHPIARIQKAVWNQTSTSMHELMNIVELHYSGFMEIAVH
jgi:hypothetical protein